MKKILKPFKILLPALFLLQINLCAQGDNENKKYEFTKIKSINKSYTVSSNSKLSIDNSFGKVEVHTWNKNEIKVDVTIEASATKEDVAQKIIDGISVAECQSDKEMSFKTKMNVHTNSKSNMKVNYNIYMPSSNPLNIANHFGATIIPDYQGEVQLESKFGSLTTGNLSNVKKILVEFGKAKFENITNGTIVIKYSKATFEKLMMNVKMDIEFSSAIKMNVNNTLSALDIKASYSTVNLKPDAALSASYIISTSFGKFKNNTSIKFDVDNEKNDWAPKFDQKYTGKSGNGSIPIKINSSFGSVILGEPTSGDLKD
mgnify:CR=1 FL=1